MFHRFRPALLAGCILASGAAHAGDARPHWTYEGAEGPAGWASLSPDYAACADGAMQSPIELGAANATGEAVIEAAYQPVPMTVLNNGHTVQIDAPGGGGFTEAGIRYDLVQIHFHTPSEHVVDGRNAPMEAHLVHKSEDGRLAVIGVMIVEGAENTTITDLYRRLPTVEAEPVTYDELTIDPSGLLPADLSLYRYMGSLTTPPCSEGVAWHVLATPVEASDWQIGGLAAVMGANNRPVQDLGDRLLLGPEQKAGF